MVEFFFWLIKILLRGVKKYNLNLDQLLIWTYPENLSKIWHCYFFADMEGVPPFLPKMWDFAWGSEKKLPSALVIYWCELFLKVWAKSGMVKFFPQICVDSPFCHKKSRFCLGAGNIFIFKLDHLLDWAFPKNLSKIRHGWVSYLIFCPPFFVTSWRFCSGAGKKFQLQPWSFWAFPESLSKNRHGSFFWLIFIQYLSIIQNLSSLEGIE